MDKEILVTVQYDKDDPDTCMCHYYTDFTFTEEYSDDDQLASIGIWRVNVDGSVSYSVIGLSSDPEWIPDQYGREVIQTIMENELLRGNDEG